MRDRLTMRAPVLTRRVWCAGMYLTASVDEATSSVEGESAVHGSLVVFVGNRVKREDSPSFVLFTWALCPEAPLPTPFQKTISRPGLVGPGGDDFTLRFVR